MKKMISVVLTALILLTSTAVLTSAASWAADDVITITVRAYDTTTGNAYAIGTDTVTKGDQYIQSDAYTIKPVATFAANAGAVQKVVGNWYFPTSDQQVGATVKFSCNSDTAVITYWVSGYTEGTGTGSTKNETINLGGSGRYTLNYTVVYHSNYPDGKDFRVSTKYTVKSYTASRNMFSSAFKTYSACSFGGFKYLSNEKTWYTDANCTTTKGTIYAANGGTYHIYAGWASAGTAAEPVTLTLYDSGEVNTARTAVAGDTVTLTVPEPAKEDAIFEGWAETENAETAAYKEDAQIALTRNTTLYAVWKAAPVVAPVAPTAPVAVPTYEQPYTINNNYAYLFGLSDTVIGANDSIRRGEASAIFYRLLKQNNQLNGFVYNADNAPVFPNLVGRWDRSSIEFMSYLGIYSTQLFENISADETITRGEAFKMFAIALGCTEDLSLTPEQYTQILVDLGHVQGDVVGTTDYRISDNITRAEFCKIYNAMIGRDGAAYKLFLADKTTPVTAATYGFTDLSADFWAYDIMLKATSSFDENGYVDLNLRAMRNALDDYTE